VLLRFGGMKVTEVAYALGYKDVYFFSRQYKKYTGRFPSSDR
jgi:YesN/AraC family two-component response regulator